MKAVPDLPGQMMMPTTMPTTMTMTMTMMTSMR
jgi:hypothetical protein